MREVHGPVRPALVAVAAQWAQFGGWLHAATGQCDAAARRFDQALGWATETGDAQMSPGFFVMGRGLVHRILDRDDRDANDRAVPLAIASRGNK